MKPQLWDIHTASDADAQRRRLETRAKLLKPLALESRISAVVGGGGVFRRLSDRLAPAIGHAVVVAGAPIETVDALYLAAGGPSRVVFLAPVRVSRPIVDEIRRRGSWPMPVDLLYGLRARDREAFIRHVLRTRGAS
jgi:hypothetical protein